MRNTACRRRQSLPAISFLVALAAALALDERTAHGEDSAAAKIDFSRQIRPLLSDKCFKCHGPDDAQREADLRLDVRDDALANAIVPGEPDASELVARITSDDPDQRMPPPESKLTLSAEQKALLAQWVAQGADYTVHWAYQKPTRPKPPATRDEDWPASAIDHFVLKRLEQKSLAPSPEADKATLVRRLSLDLTGLPPATREVDRFVNDDRPRAYERLVDRLLASQHYGERMAQDWLDLARYGDTNGYENDSDRKMWLYRDWVVNAFNTNMPLDRFTTEQIAGDLLPSADNSQKIASGFNRNTTYNEEGGSDPEEFLVVYAVERASTTATVFLGLTFGCAQCHDHKYDPFSQKEFYQFYAFFNSVDGEKGAMGHDIPLPPLLSLATKEQTENLDRTQKELTETEARIKQEVANVQIVATGQSTDTGEANEKKSAEKNNAEKENAQKENTEKENTEKKYFDTQDAWESHERQRAESPVPAKILDIVKLEPLRRSDQQKTTLRDYFVEHAYAGARHRFEPLHKLQDELTKQRDQLNKAIPTTMIMKEMVQRRPAHVLIRGDFQQKGQQVEPNVPAIFPPLPAGVPKNRLALAHWLVDPNNPLVARVAVNRFWKQLFGTPLVKTMDDFGVRGEYPSHPELLDWLATELVRTGWNVKGLVKTIAMSATYRQSSRYRPEAAKVDPYNRLLARQNRFRLTAEEIRDTALTVSGLLDDEIGGRSVFPYQPEGYYSDKGRWKWHESQGKALYRRGLYTFWRRTTTYPTFQIFDAPSRETCTVDRPRTNTPLQALVTLNDPTFVEAARVFAERIMESQGPSLDEKISFAFQTTLAREPDEREREILTAVYDDQFARFTADAKAAAALVQHGRRPAAKGVDVVQLAAWTALANVLLNLDETITRP